MARSRSRSRDRDRRRGKSNSRERRRARSRSRDRKRDRDKDRDRDRNRDRDTHMSTKHRQRSRSASTGRNRDHYAAEDSEAKRKRDLFNGKEGHQDAFKSREEPEEDKKKARLERLAAWKQQQQQQQQQQEQPAGLAPEDPAEQPNEQYNKPSEQPANVWLPWEDPSTAYGNSIPTVPREILEKQARAAAKLAEEKAREIVEAADVDPLDAFMAAEILPEVKQKEQEEAAKKEEERIKLAKQLAEGKIPKLDEILEDSDEEPEPDAVIEVPLKKVKLVVGPGGEKIRLIEKKSKARLQILKEEDELNKAFGSGPAKPVLPKPASGEEQGQKMTKIMIFGNSNQCEIAQRMIEEAIDNKEQKAKQRQKEYEKKRDAKARDRQLYHMRHTRDYETLELPIGASRVEVKAAYRKLAKVWHPDKHPNNQEEAKERFQRIQKAYDSLMLTEEDARIEALAN